MNEDDEDIYPDSSEFGYAGTIDTHSFQPAILRGFGAISRFAAFNG
jgi:hypothetical protein